MADPIPDEDSISHVMLWKRIDGARDSINSTLSQMESHWQQSVDSITANIKQMIKENQKFMDQKQADLDSNLKEQNKTVELSMETALAKFSQKLDEYMGRIETKFNSLQSAVYEKVDNSVQASSLESRNNFSNAKKELEIVLNNTVSGMQGRITDLQRSVDLRLNGLEEATIKKAETEVEKRLSDIMSQATSIQDAVSSYQKDTIDSITRFQSEAMKKISDMNDMFNSIKDKFSQLSKLLQ